MSSDDTSYLDRIAKPDNRVMVPADFFGDEELAELERAEYQAAVTERAAATSAVLRMRPDGGADAQPGNWEG